MAGGGQQPGQGENHYNYLWLLLGGAVVLWLVWHFGHTYIVAGIYRLKIFEIDIISLFTDKLQGMKLWIYDNPASYVNLDQVWDIATKVGDYIRIPIFLTLLALAFAMYMGQPVSRFKKTYSVERLVQAEKDNWHMITPVVEKDLINTDIDEGEWAMAQTPLQFAKQNDLMIIKTIEPDEETLSTEVHLALSIDKGKTSKLFALQIGRPWRGVDALSPHARALFAVFAAKGNRDTDAANDILEQLSYSSTSALDFKGVNALLNKHKDAANVQEKINQHAYELTVMASMLELAREDGVLASAEFLWLKPVDRPLWYMLNCVGRQTAHSETAGPFAHWLAEKRLQRALQVPMVNEAVMAMDEAIKTYVYKPEGDA